LALCGEENLKAIGLGRSDPSAVCATRDVFAGLSGCRDLATWAGGNGASHSAGWSAWEKTQAG